MVETPSFCYTDLKTKLDELRRRVKKLEDWDEKNPDGLTLQKVLENMSKGSKEGVSNCTSRKQEGVLIEKPPSNS